MDELVWEQAADMVILVPLGEIVGAAAVFAAAMMLQPDPAHLVGQREQKFISVERARPEQRDGFGHQRCVASDMVGAGVEIFGFVGDDVQRDILAEIPFAEMAPGEHRAVDQHLVIGRGEAVAVATDFQPVERRGAGPPVGQGHLQLHGDLPREITGGIKADLFPLQVHHRRGDDHAAFAGARRRQEIEGDVDALDPGGHIDVERIDIGRLARPRQRLAARARLEPRHFGDRAARGVLAGQPFGIEQGQLAGLGDRDRLAHAKDAARDVGGIDAKLHRARIGFVGGQRDDVRLDDRLRAAVAVLREGGGDGGDQGGCDEQLFFHGRVVAGNGREVQT